MRNRIYPKRFLTLAMAGVLLLFTPNIGRAAPNALSRDAQCVAFSSDGQLAATGKSGLANAAFPPRPHPTPSKCGVIHIWNTKTGKIVQRMETFGDLTKVQFSEDGKLLATSRVYQAANGVPLDEVCLWNVKTGKPHRHFSRCHSFAFSANGDSIAVLSRTKCVVYDLKSFRKTATIKLLGGAIAICASPAGESLAAVMPEKGKYMIRLCNGDGELIAQSSEFRDPFYSLAFSPDGRSLASGHIGGNVYIWDSADMKSITRHNAGNGELQQPFFSPDGSILGSGGQSRGDVVFWNIASGKKLHRYTYKRGSFRTFYPRTSSQQIRPEKSPQRFTFAPDGTTFFAGCHGGILRTLSTGQEVRRFSE